MTIHFLHAQAWTAMKSFHCCTLSYPTTTLFMMTRSTNKSMTVWWVALSARWWRICAWRQSKNWPSTPLKYNLKCGNAMWMTAFVSSKGMLSTPFILHWKNFQISKYDFNWILLVFDMDFLSYPNLVKMQFFHIWFSICILDYPKLENYNTPDLVLVQSKLGFTTSQPWITR